MTIEYAGGTNGLPGQEHLYSGNVPCAFHHRPLRRSSSRPNYQYIISASQNFHHRESQSRPGGDPKKGDDTCEKRRTKVSTRLLHRVSTCSSVNLGNGAYKFNTFFRSRGAFTRVNLVVAANRERTNLKCYSESQLR